MKKTLTTQQATIFDAIKSGDAAKLAELRTRASADGNDLVEIDWEMSYDPENHQLISLYSLTAKDTRNIVVCTLGGMSKEEAVLASGLASLIELEASRATSYTGWLWRDYTPAGPETITGEVYGQLKLADGTSRTFKFTRTLEIPR